MPSEPKAASQETYASQDAGSEDAPKQTAPGSEKSDAKIPRDGVKCALGQFDRIVKLAGYPCLHFGLADFERSPQLRFHDSRDHNAKFFPCFLCIALKDCFA